MGNNQSALKFRGENLKDYLRRRFGCISRRRRIDELVILAIQGEDEKFRKYSAGIKWKKSEVNRFFSERDEILDEFDENVIEIEIGNLGHETPSEFSDSDDEFTDSDSDEYESESATSSDNEFGPDTINLAVITPEPLRYSDPLQQIYHEQDRRLAMEKESDDLMSVSELEEFEEYKYMIRDTKLCSANCKVCARAADNKSNRMGTDATSIGSQPTREFSIRPEEMGGGEKINTNDGKSVGAYALENGEVNAGDRLRDTNADGATLTDPLPRQGKRRFLQRITEGLKQRQPTPSRARSTLSRRSCADVTSFGHIEGACAQNEEQGYIDAEVQIEDLGNIDTNKAPIEIPVSKSDENMNEPPKKKKGFFRRLLARFHGKRSSCVSSNSVIQVQPTTLNIDCPSQ